MNSADVVGLAEQCVGREGFDSPDEMVFSFLCQVANAYADLIQPEPDLEDPASFGSPFLAGVGVVDAVCNGLRENLEIIRGEAPAANK